jgi:hypothetical protein
MLVGKIRRIKGSARPPKHHSVEPTKVASAHDFIGQASTRLVKNASSILQFGEGDAFEHGRIPNRKANQ